MALIATKENGNLLTIFLKGHIDSANAGDVEKEIEVTRAQSSASDLLLDA